MITEAMLADMTDRELQAFIISPFTDELLCHDTADAWAIVDSELLRRALRGSECFDADSIIAIWQNAEPPSCAPELGSLLLAAKNRRCQ